MAGVGDSNSGRVAAGPKRVTQGSASAWQDSHDQDDLLGRHSFCRNEWSAFMNRISPAVLGILVVVGGVCAALPFQRRARRHITAEPATNSETIQWRSNDFTLEVIARDQPLNDSPSGRDRPSSPAFGRGNGATITSPASLDDITQPPVLAGAYGSTTSISPFLTALWKPPMRSRAQRISGFARSV